MKFSFKMVIGTMLIIIVMFSLSGMLLIHENFKNAFILQMKTNTAQHDLEKYSLETMLSEYILDHNEIDTAAIKKYLYTQSVYSENTRKMAVFVNDEVLWGNLPFAYDENLTSGDIISDDKNKYVALISETQMNHVAIRIISCFDITAIYQVRNQNIICFYFIEAGMLLICACLITVFARFLTKPIQSLNEAAKQVSAGHRDVHITSDAKDEVGELAASFAIMIDAIKQREEKLQQAVKQREDFIANFTHELKTPMTSVIGYTKILQKDHYSKEDKKKALQYIYSETKRLEVLSHKLLELMELSEQRISLQPVHIDDLFTAVKQLAHDRLHIQTLITEKEAATVLGDEQLLITCMMNLLENAQKASDAQSEIRLCGKRKAQYYEIAITDHGIGIAESEIKRISESFYTVDKARSKANGGYGLGLSLCSDILKLHHSELRFQSEIGKGTVVSFYLEVIDDETV